MTSRCKICQKDCSASLVRAREMMFGFREEFEYFECAHCGCVQIAEFPKNISKYYPAEYSAHKTRDFADEYGRQPFWKRCLRDCLAEHDLGRPSLIGRLLSKKYRSGIPYWIREAGAELCLDSAILEVGAGAGDKLLDLSRRGFRNLSGIDPFIASDLKYPGGVRIVKGDWEVIDGDFDFIMLHHSFEHMPNPHVTCRKLRARLRPKGVGLIRIPVGGCYAWKKYGVNWVQLDAPRHFFLHSKKSLSLVAEAAGLEVFKVIYDSKAFQFWGSEQYQLDIPLKDPRSPFCNPSSQSLFTPQKMSEWTEEALKLNEAGDGDQACFFLRAK